MKPVKKKAKTFTTEQLIKWLNAKYGSKLTGQFIYDKAEGQVEFEDKNGHVF